MTTPSLTFAFQGGARLAATGDDQAGAGPGASPKHRRKKGPATTARPFL